MAYLVLADLKVYLGIGSADTSDDTLLGQLLTAGQAAIDQFCDRTFEATSATKYYREEDVDGSILYLGADLVTVTTLTNGDGSVIASSSYWLQPRNLGAPYSSIELKSTHSGWRFATQDSEISVAGTWGYSATAPPVVVQAIRELVEFYYRRQDRAARVLSMGGAGIGGLPLPTHVEQLLLPLRRLG